MRWNIDDLLGNPGPDQQGNGGKDREQDFECVPHRSDPAAIARGRKFPPNDEQKSETDDCGGGK